MNQSTPAHKQTDPAKAPGQIVNPITRDGYKRAMMMHPYGTSSGRISCADPYAAMANTPKPGVSAEEKMAVASIGTSNALGNDGTELEGSTCD